VCYNEILFLKKENRLLKAVMNLYVYSLRSFDEKDWPSLGTFLTVFLGFSGLFCSCYIFCLKGVALLSIEFLYCNIKPLINPALVLPFLSIKSTISLFFMESYCNSILTFSFSFLAIYSPTSSRDAANPYL